MPRNLTRCGSSVRPNAFGWHRRDIVDSRMLIICDQRRDYREAPRIDPTSKRPAVNSRPWKEEMSRKVGFTVAAVTLGLSGCAPYLEQFLAQFERSFGDSVIIPQSDNTPPDVSLHIPSGNGEIVLHVGDGPRTIPIKPSDTFYVVAVAEDQQGVRSVSLYASQSISCTADRETGGGAATGYSSYVGPGSPGKTGLTRLWMPYQVSGGLVTCPPDSDANNSSYSIAASGENFSGKRASTPWVTFVPAPK